MSLDGSSPKKYDLSPYKISFDSNNAILPTYVSADYLKNVSVTYPSYEGTSDLVKLATKLGLTIYYNGSCQQVFWRVPSLSYSSLLKTIHDFGVLSNSNGFVISSNLTGQLELFDFKAILDAKNVMVIEGNILSSQASKSWINASPGEYQVNVYSKEGLKSKSLKILEGFGKSVIDTLQSSDSSEFIERKLSNDFWRNYYTAWNVVIECTSPTIPIPGMAVVSKLSKYPFICRGLRITAVDGATTNVTVTLCRPFSD